MALSNTGQKEIQCPLLSNWSCWPRWEKDRRGPQRTPELARRILSRGGGGVKGRGGSLISSKPQVAKQFSLPKPKPLRGVQGGPLEPKDWLIEQPRSTSKADGRIQPSSVQAMDPLIPAEPANGAQQKIIQHLSSKSGQHLSGWCACKGACFLF